MNETHTIDPDDKDPCAPLKASELIGLLQDMIAIHGDADVVAKELHAGEFTVDSACFETLADGKPVRQYVIQIFGPWAESSDVK